jgi:hypothetical protein
MPYGAAIDKRVNLAGPLNKPTNQDFQTLPRGPGGTGIFPI